MKDMCYGEIPRTIIDVICINGIYVYANDFELFNGIIGDGDQYIRVIDGIIHTPSDEDHEAARRAPEHWQMGFFTSGNDA